MNRLDFSNPVTRRLTPGSNDYTNPNTNYQGSSPASDSSMYGKKKKH